MFVELLLKKMRYLGSLPMNFYAAVTNKILKIVYEWPKFCSEILSLKKVMRKTNGE